jgi:hypothetical protein
MEIPPSLFQASASNHLTFVLLLSEGQTGETWELYTQNDPLSSPQNKMSLTSFMSFPFHLSLYYSSFSLFLHAHKN